MIVSRHLLGNFSSCLFFFFIPVLIKHSSSVGANNDDKLLPHCSQTSLLTVIKSLLTGCRDVMPPEKFNFFNFIHLASHTDYAMFASPESHPNLLSWLLQHLH